MGVEEAADGDWANAFSSAAIFLFHLSSAFSSILLLIVSNLAVSLNSSSFCLAFSSFSLSSFSFFSTIAASFWNNSLDGDCGWIV